VRDRLLGAENAECGLRIAELGVNGFPQSAFSAGERPNNKITPLIKIPHSAFRVPRSAFSAPA